jgi:hypothetical protein
VGDVDRDARCSGDGRECWRDRAYGDFWSYMLLAEGAVDIAPSLSLALHDMAALVPIVTEAGGRFTVAGRPVDGPFGGNALATNGLLHDEVLHALTPELLSRDPWAAGLSNPLSRVAYARSVRDDGHLAAPERAELESAYALASPTIDDAPLPRPRICRMPPVSASGVNSPIASRLAVVKVGGRPSRDSPAASSATSSAVAKRAGAVLRMKSTESVVSCAAEAVAGIVEDAEQQSSKPARSLPCAPIRW